MNEPISTSDVPATADEGLSGAPEADRTGAEESPSNGAARSDRATNIAAIDVGTNSIHLVIAQISPQGDFSILSRDRDMVQLGKGGFVQSLLTPEAMATGIETLRRYRRMAESHGVGKIKAVATSAVREAHNGGEFVERVRREVDLDLHVISAQEEGRLIYLGVRHAVDLGTGNNLVIDIGGGSVELILGNAHEARRIESLKLGGSRLAELYLHSDPPKHEEVKALRRHIATRLKPALTALAAEPINRVIATSGTVRHLAGLCAARRERGGEGGARPRIGRVELKGLLAELLSRPRAARLKMRGMEPKRVDASITAATLLYLVMDRLEIAELEHFDVGLREGLLVDYIGRHREKLLARATWPDPRARSVIYLAERCRYKKAHAEQVARLALRMFDGLQELHRLPRSYRELLYFAGLLHDVGYLISHQGHHKHSYYLISNGELMGFSEQEIEIIANVARYHRKDRPKKSHYSFQRVLPEHRRSVARLASLLRLADALDRTHYSVVADVRCTVQPDGVTMEILSDRDAELEIWTASRNVDLFEREFGLPVRLQLAPSTPSENEP